ncbi:putative pentatricopeptide repeat domain-containing protein [Diaporthe ampelina]|uniref:Putative pentatricopeptide repeat domain-containing protein n=1 Tax=Diaporthe ampelina TaxID=1214573 RepID=A0A0G2HNU0_9PEZI|nr:putative pentatricopeptide repeat domain-containing protein [Diaporthe ampelina]
MPKRPRQRANQTECLEQPTRETPEKIYTVKYFEKDARGEVRQVSSGEDADDVDMDDIKALEASALAKIEKLDATLESLNKKTEFLERILQHGPKGALQAYREASQAYEFVSETTPIPLIAERDDRSDLADAEKGFRLYRRMRDLAAKLDQPMEIGDYDDVISVFLTSGHTDYAMYAFTDMIYSGTVNLYGNSKLPSSVKNLFFFGKWLKRLIGARDLDGAYKVLVYMQNNGVMAAAVQVNGLIGAWLRSRTTENRKKAELLAWSMIHARKAFVELRQRERSIEWPISLHDGRPNNPKHDGDDLDYRMVPRATAETFILMAENYRERGLFYRLEELFVAYKECEIGGDAKMMNELIMAAVTQGDAEKARELYDLMVHENAILPNTDTYAILFKSLPINTLRGRQLHQISPTLAADSQRQARAFFKDMVSSMGLHLERRRTRHGELSEEQVKLILHSFRKCADWAGVIVALVCLRDLMRFKITRNVLLDMIAEYEGIDRPSGRSTKLVMLTTMKLQTMIQKRQKRLLRDQAQSEDPGRGAGEDVKAEAAKTPNELKDPHALYDILLEYYYRKAEVDYRDKAYLTEVFETAEDEMGTADFASYEPPAAEDEVDTSELEEEVQ